MSEQEKPTVVVVGATSKQGSSVVCSLLESGRFTVKALTQDSNSPGAQDLAKRGATLVEGDATVATDLHRAFKDAHGVFAMTFGAPLTEPLEKAIEAEFAAGKAQADAAAGCKVKVFVFSTLEDVDKRSQGKYHVPYFTAKARVMEYVKATYPDMTAVFPSPAYFYTNFIQYYKPTRDADGTLAYLLPLAPDARVPFVNPFASVGPVVTAVLLDPGKYAGQLIPVWDEQLTPTELVATFSKVTGQPAKYLQASNEAWFSRPVPEVASQVIWDGYKYAEEFGYYAPDRDMQLVRKIVPKPFTWAELLRTTGYDGSQSFEEVRARLWCTSGVPKREE